MSDRILTEAELDEMLDYLFEPLDFDDYYPDPELTDPNDFVDFDLFENVARYEDQE